MSAENNTAEPSPFTASRLLGSPQEELPPFAIRRALAFHDKAIECIRQSGEEAICVLPARDIELITENYVEHFDTLKKLRGFHGRHGFMHWAKHIQSLIDAQSDVLCWLAGFQAGGGSYSPGSIRQLQEIKSLLERLKEEL